MQRLRYGADPAQYAELSRPEGPARGVVVLLHGGFWRQEYDLSLGRPLAADLRERGWSALNVEYRRVGAGGGVPSTLDDVSAALDSLAATDLDRAALVVVGHSAGGQLAAWSAGRARLARWSSARVLPTHVVSQAGVLDLRGAAREDLGGGAVPDFLGGGPEQRPDAYRDADPLGQVPLEQPVWCVHGREDGTVPLTQSQRYVAAARQAGARAVLEEVDGDHLSLVDVRSPGWAAVVRILDGIEAPAS